VAVSLKGVLPKIRDFAETYARNESVAAVGLFGSWARHEASASSALDILAVDGSDLDFEYHELAVHGGLILDINRIPWKWVGEVVVPGVDHRLHEALILHDPGGLLRRAKEFVEGNYRTPGRVEIRTESYLTSADMYLSRSSSAITRGDLETASLYAEKSLVPASHVLMDVAGVPIARDALVWNLRRACEGVGLIDFFRAFIEATGLSGLDGRDVTRCLHRFEGTWRHMSGRMMEEQRIVDGLHGVLRREIYYLADPAMLRLVLGRAREMLEVNNFVGAAMYMRGWLLPLLEAYAWVISAVRGDKFDYTSLFKIIREEGVEGAYDAAIGVFDMQDLTESVHGQAVDQARSLVSRIRGARRGLIDRFVN